jgi:hypothetical protein
VHGRIVVITRHGFGHTSPVGGRSDTPTVLIARHPTVRRIGSICPQDTDPESSACDASDCGLGLGAIRNSFARLLYAAPS